MNGRIDKQHITGHGEPINDTTVIHEHKPFSGRIKKLHQTEPASPRLTRACGLGFMSNKSAPRERKSVLYWPVSTGSTYYKKHDKVENDMTEVTETAVSAVRNRFFR